MKKHLLMNFIFLIFPFLLDAVETKVVLLSGGEKEYRQKVESVITDVLNGVNKNYEARISLDNIKSKFTEEAFKDFKILIKETKLYALQKEYRTYLLATTNGLFEVRNLKVLVSLGNTAGIPFQNLVIVLNKNGLIENAHFSIEKHHYQEIIEQGKELNDLAYREKILHFIEIYRTAYNKKDLTFIERTLSEEAIIIVGYVVKTKEQDHDYLEKSYLDDAKIRFIRLGKHEYLGRLKKVFKNNDFVQVQFDEVNIQRHQQFDKIYGVQLKQRWNSSNYGDEGYLFLMVDFMNEEEPIIHVRAWQPDKFSDGSTINVYDFEVIE